MTETEELQDEEPTFDATPTPDRWHVYRMPDGTAHVHGPTPVPAETMASVADYMTPDGEDGATYLTALDHEPGQAELRKLVAG